MKNRKNSRRSGIAGLAFLALAVSFAVFSEGNEQGQKIPDSRTTHRESVLETKKSRPALQEGPQVISLRFQAKMIEGE